MNKFEALWDEFYEEIPIWQTTFLPRKLSGFYDYDGIFLKTGLTQNKYHCVLAEELGHFKTTLGNIIEQKTIRARQQEVIARRWGHKKIVTLDDLIECYENYITTVEEICDYLEIVPEFLEECLIHYRQQYGQDIYYKDYLLILDPLDIKRKKELAMD